MRLIRGLELLAVNISSGVLLAYDLMSIFCCFMSYDSFRSWYKKNRALISAPYCTYVFLLGLKRPSF